MTRRNIWPDKRQLRRMRRKHRLRVNETASSVVVHFSDPGREVRSTSDLTMMLETGLKIRFAAVRGWAQTHYRALNLGHGTMISDDGEIVEF